MIPLLRPSGLVAALAAAALTSTSFGLSDAEMNAGRAIVKQRCDAVIGVEMVVTIKISQAGRPGTPRESKLDVNGTVISDSGLTVTSLGAIDPRVQFESMRALMSPGMEVGETDYKEVKLRLADGTEVPARVVLKDADLDLAFIAPDTEASTTKHTFKPLSLDGAAEGKVLETYFVMSRAPKSLQRVPLIRPSLVLGVVEKPRRIYLMNDQAMGCPVFDQGGRVLGISLQERGGSGRSAGLVVVPAADIAEVARQAAVAQATPAPKPAPAGDTPTAATETPPKPEAPAKKE